MPTLPAPLPFSLLGDLVVRASDEVRRFLPVAFRRAKEAPTRELLLGALVAIARHWQRLASYAIEQSAIPTATDQYLDGLVGDYALARADDEADGQLRARALAAPEQVSPKALLGVINAIVGLHSSVPVRLLEPSLDSWFVHDGDAVWHSFVEAPPEYPDRLYAPGAGGGVRRDQSEPHGALPHGDPYGRELLLLMPTIEPEGAAAFVSDSPEPTEDELQFFVDEAPTEVGFVWASPSTTRTVYEALANSLDRILGHGIRVAVVETPELA